MKLIEIEETINIKGRITTLEKEDKIALSDFYNTID